MPREKDKATTPDIREQLSDIQNRLFSSGSKDKSPRKSTEKKPHKKHHDSANPTVSPATLTHSLVPHTVPSLGPESKGNDMNYVVGLSQNLVHECRRLNAENQKLKGLLKTNAHETETLRDQVLALLTRRDAQAVSETDLKDKNWELESMTFTLKEQLAELSAAKEKITQTLRKQEQELQTLQKQNAELLASHSSGSQDTDKLKSAHNKEIAQLNERIQELNDENDKLTMNLDTVKSRNTQGVVDLQRPPLLAANANELSDDDSFDFDSMLQDTNPHEVPQGNYDNPAVEIETLKASLNHAHKTIAKLRSNLLKARFETPKFPETSSPVKLKTTKKLKNKADLSNTSKSTVLSPSKRSSKFIVLENDTSQSEFPTEEGRWEDFVGPDEELARAHKRFSILNSTELHDSDDDISINKANTIQEVPVKTHMPELTDSEGEDSGREGKTHNLNAELMNAVITKEQFEDYARKNNLVILPLDAYESMQNPDITKIEDSALILVLRERNIIAVTKKEYDELLDESEMKKKLESKGLITIPVTELNGYKKTSEAYEAPDLEYVTSKAKVCGCEVIPTEELSSLKKIAEDFKSPSSSYLIEHCKEKSLVAITADKYDQLQHTETEHTKPTRDYIKSKANELGLIVTPSAFHDELLQKANEPDVDHLVSKAEKHGMTVIEKKKLMELENPNAETIKYLAERNNLTAIPSEDYDSLYEMAHNPLVDHLKEKLETQDHTVLSQSAYNSLLKPSILSVIATAAGLGFATLLVKELSELKKSANEPSLSQVKTHAEKLGLITLQKKEYLDLYKTATEPSLEFLQKEAQAKEYELLKKQDAERLISLSKDPSLEFLKDKASTKGFKIIGDDTYKSLTNPSLDKLEQIAGALHHSVIEVLALESLKQKALDPSEEQIEALAEEKGFVVVPKANHEGLLRQAESPTLDELKMHAEKEGLSLITNHELADIKLKLAKPSQEYLSQHAATLQYHLVPLEDWDAAITKVEELDRISTKPTTEDVERLSQPLGLGLIPQSELQELQKLANEPPVSHIIDKAKQLKMVALADEKYIELKELAESPSKQHLEKAAANIGYEVIDKEEISKMRDEIANPDKEKIVEQAGKYGLATIGIEELSQMKKSIDSPSVEYLKQKAQEHGQVLLLQTDYSETLEKANNPSNSHLESKAKAAGYSLIASHEFEDLSRRAESPTLDEISKHASNQVHRIISQKKFEELHKLANDPPKKHLDLKALAVGALLIDQKDHEKLLQQVESPNKAYLTDKAAIHNCSLIETDVLDDLQSKLDKPSLGYLEQQAKNRNMVLLPTLDWEKTKQLTESPSTDYIKERADKLGLIAVEKAAWESMKKTVHQPSLEFLQDHVSLYDRLLVTNQEYETLKHPSKQQVVELAEAYDSVLIQKKEYADLSATSSNPSVEHLRGKASAKGFVLLESEKYQQLLDEVNDTSKEKLAEKAAAIGMKAIAVHKFEQMTKKLEEPTRDYLASKAEKNGLVLIDDKELQGLRMTAEQPSAQFLTEKSENLGMVVIDKKDLEELKQTVKSPSHEFLQLKAGSKGFSLIGDEDYKTLEQAAKSPTISQLKSHCAALQYQMVPIEEFKKMKETTENPSIEHLKNNAAKKNMTVVSISEHKKLSDIIAAPTREHLEEKADSAGLAVVLKDDYSTMKATLTSPSVEFLRESGAKLGLSLVEDKEYGQLKAQIERPDFEYLKKKAAEQQSVIVAKSELSAIQERLSNPSIDYLLEKAESHHKLLIDEEEATKLRTIYVKPDKDFLSQKASALGLVVVDDIEHSKLLELHKLPTQDYLKTKAEAQQMTLLTNEEFDRLVDPDIASVEQNAEKLGYTTIKRSELEKMKVLIESPPLEYLKEKASSLDQVLIAKKTLDVYETLVKSPTKDDLEKLAAKTRMSVINTEELESLKIHALSPDEAHLKSVSKPLGLSVVPDQVLQELNSKAKRPIEEQAKEAGKVLLDETELASLKQNAEKPSLDTLVATALLYDHVVVDKTAHDQLTSEANRSLADRAQEEKMIVLPIAEHQELVANAYKPSADHVSSKAAALGLGLLTLGEIKQLKDYKKTPLSVLAAKEGKVLIDKPELEELTQKAYQPDVKYLTQKADTLGHVVIPIDTHKKLLDSVEKPSLEYLKTNAYLNDHVLVSKSEFATTKELAEEPIESKAGKLNKILVGTEDYNKTKRQIALLQTQLDDPSMEYLKDKATKTNMSLIDADELAELRTKAEESVDHKAKSLGLVVVKEQEYTELLEKSTEPLQVKAANEKMHVISEEEFKELQELKAPSESFVKKHAGKLGLAVLGVAALETLEKGAQESLESKASKESKVALPVEEHASLLSPSFEKVKEHALLAGYELVEREELKELLKFKEVPLSVRADDEGKVLVPREELSEMKEKLNNPSAEYIAEKSKAHGLIAINSNELEQLHAKASKTLKELAEEQQVKLLPENEYDELLVEAKQPSIEKITRVASENGFKVITEDEYEDLNQYYLEPLEAKAEANGMVLLLKDDHENPKKDFLLEKLSLLGLAAVATSEYDQLKKLAKELTEDKAAKEGKVVLTKQDHKELADKSSIPAVKKLLENRDTTLFQQELENEGYRLVPLMSQENTSTDSFKRVGPSENIANSIIEARGRRVSRDGSLYSLDNNFIDAEDSVYLDEEELALSASRIGMVVVRKEDYLDLVSKKLELEDVENYAKEANLALLSEAELLQLKQSLVEKDAKLSELSLKDHLNSKDSILALLPEFNLIALDQEEYHNLKKAQVDSLTGDQIPSLAEKFGLSVVSQDDQKRLLEAQRTLQDDKLFSQAAKQKGFIMVPSASFIATTAMREPDGSRVTLVPSSYYNKLVKNEYLNVEKLSDEAFKSYAEKRGYTHEDDLIIPVGTGGEVDSHVSPNLTPEVAQVAKFRPPSGASIVKTPVKASPSKLPHSASVLSNMSVRSHVGSITSGMLSMATNVSLTDQSMIPAITQVVIGEFLFKYYRRIGAFSSIAETRHERYFWVHPYSLTLYWSTVNPVLSNPAEVKTRAAAIVRVESVEDNNPLPTGLYHKSIIVHSQSRSIKITCPTRKRHNIWYNALRYMISRNMGDLEFEKDQDKFEERDEEDNERIDTLFEPSAERHAFPRKRVSSTTSQIFRSSSTARLSRFASMRR